jgi:very-short-patch-repair endonuclease
MDAPRPTRKRAKELRGSMSLPEVLLWRELRRQNMDGLRFRRQHPLGPYVLDFYCDEVKLAVEVDGEWHSFGPQPARDRARDAWLAANGVRTLRLSARYVLKQMQDALETIVREARSPPQSASPTAPPEGEHP